MHLLIYYYSDQVMDVRKLTFADGQFDVIIDKGKGSTTLPIIQHSTYSLVVSLIISITTIIC